MMDYGHSKLSCYALTIFFICRLPEGFTQLRNLTNLGLNDISLMRLPPDIGRYGGAYLREAKSM